MSASTTGGDGPLEEEAGGREGLAGTAADSTVAGDGRADETAGTCGADVGASAGGAALETAADLVGTAVVLGGAGLLVRGDGWRDVPPRVRCLRFWNQTCTCRGVMSTAAAIRFLSSRPGVLSASKAASSARFLDALSDSLCRGAAASCWASFIKQRAHTFGLVGADATQGESISRGSRGGYPSSVHGVATSPTAPASSRGRAGLTPASPGT